MTIVLPPHRLAAVLWSRCVPPGVVKRCLSLLVRPHQTLNDGNLFCGQVKDLETRLQRLQSDLHTCVSFIQEPKKLKESVQVTFSRHGPQADRVTMTSLGLDSSLRRSFPPYMPANSLHTLNLVCVV